MSLVAQQTLAQPTVSDTPSSPLGLDIFVAVLPKILQLARSLTARAWHGRGSLSAEAALDEGTRIANRNSCAQGGEPLQGYFLICTGSLLQNQSAE